MRQIGFSFANREFVNDRRFDVMRDVELADRFLEPAIVMIHRATAAPVGIGVGQ